MPFAPLYGTFSYECHFRKQLGIASIISNGYNYMHWLQSTTPHKHKNGGGGGPGLFAMESADFDNSGTPNHNGVVYYDGEKIGKTAHHYTGEPGGDGADSFNPYPQIMLRHGRFLGFVLLGVACVVGVMSIFLAGITLKKGIVDPIGSSKNADKEVEHFQFINGYVTNALTQVMEKSFAIFLTVMGTYLANLKWYPTDQPSMGQTGTKKVVLIMFIPLVMYVLNIGLSSINIQHTTTGVQHIFVDEDLIITGLSVSSSNATDGIPVKDTILRSATLHQVKSFEIFADSPCLNRSTEASKSDAEEEVISLPTVKDIRSTSVVFGFPLETWNQAAIPNGLSADHSINFTYDSLDTVLDSFTAFQQASGFNFLTGYEIFLQGKTLLERSVSDTNVSAEYPCTFVDGKAADDLPAEVVTDPNFVSNSSFDYFTEGEYVGMRLCTGAISSLQDLANITDSSTHNLETFVNTVMLGINKTLKYIAVDEITLWLETYEVSKQINFTAMTIDIPLSEDVQYRDLLDYCTENGTLSEEFLESYGEPLSQEDQDAFAAILCSQMYYPFDNSRSMCGSENCIFLDKSGQLPLKKQVQLLPYYTDCSVVDMTYSNIFLNFLPHNCTALTDSVFLYGLGTYMIGDEYSLDTDADSFPYIVNPRRHILLTFVKMDWKLMDVSAMFSATCGIEDGCDGLVHVLHNLTESTSNHTQVLIAGNQTLPQARFASEFANPVQLVTLNAQPFYYPDEGRYFEWEYLNKANFANSTWARSLAGDECHVLIDSYIQQVEANIYFLEDPLQTMYTAAIYYLFQNAAVKDVVLPAEYPEGKVKGLYFGTTTRFKGDKEKKEIKFSIPTASAIATFVGVGALFVLSVMVFVLPRDRVRLAPEANFSAQFTSVLLSGEYSEAVHERKLIYPSGQIVRVDDFQVDSITFHRIDAPRTKVFL